MSRTGGLCWAVALAFGVSALSIGLFACATSAGGDDGNPNGGLQPSPPVDGGGPPPVTPHDAGGGGTDAGIDAPSDAGTANDTGTGTQDICTVGDAGADAGCYAI